jgi:hypothetical protein
MHLAKPKVGAFAQERLIPCANTEAVGSTMERSNCAALHR